MANFISLLRKSIQGLDRYLAFLFVSWLVVMVSLPLLKNVFGERAFLQGLTLTVLIQVLIVLQVLYRAWGWWPMLRVALGVVLLAWAAQAIGTSSGYPFGSFKFTSLLQPQVLRVPFHVPLMWLMMLPPAWAIARLISRKANGCLVRPLFVLTSALAFTAWDFYLDPQIVRWGILEWNPPGGYFGIPWTNLLGWLVVSGVISFVVSPKRLPGGLLVLIYALIWLVNFIWQLSFWGLPGSALAGFFAMGSMLLYAAIMTR